MKNDFTHLDYVKLTPAYSLLQGKRPGIFQNELQFRT